MKILKHGEKKKLPDGRTVSFIQTNNYYCDGCAFEFEICGKYERHVGPCGSGRPDGKVGVFIQCEPDE